MANNFMASKKQPIARENIFYFMLTAFALFIADQLSKLAVIKFVSFADDKIDIIDGFFSIIHVTNAGAAWGMLSGRTYFLSSIALLTLVAIWLFRRELGFEFKSVCVCMGMFVGGVLGNLLDRITCGHVVDFLDVYIPYVNYRWPAFNIADCGICVGVFLYIVISMAFLPKEQKK